MASTKALVQVYRVTYRKQGPLIRQRPVLPERLPDELHPVLKRIYAARGMVEPGDLSTSLEDLLSFELLGNIRNAVTILHESLRHRKNILIIGDYDADGATSTALLIRGLRQMGFESPGYILPNRFEYGYGLSTEIVKIAAEKNPDLIITVDNGIASIQGVALAREMGMQVIITDHHLPGKNLPEANAIVNPNQPGDRFPDKALAGVGVAFYVLMALRAFLRDQNWFSEQGIPEPNLADLLDLVALGTVADVVPLSRNNRILVEQGLRRMRGGQCQPGIVALLDVAGIDARYLRSSDLGFLVAPRLNAAGRLDDMSIGVECLLADDADAAADMARELDRMNHERRKISGQMQDEAEEILSELHLSDQELPRVYCLYREHWHEGVAGILAGRIREQMHRPVIVFAGGNHGELKGSARSVPGFHIRDALDAVANANPEMIRKFGGHAMAAGLSISPDHLQNFSRAINDYAASIMDEWMLHETIDTDGCLDADDINDNFALLLERSGPWGQGNPVPLFEGTFRVLGRQRVGSDKKHLKLLLEYKGLAVEAIAFSVSDEQCPPDAGFLDIVYELSLNRFRDRQATQLVVRHVTGSEKH